MSCDFEMPSVFNQTTPRARTRYRCCECHGWIETGERYQYSWGLWEGSGNSYKTCSGCAKLRDEVGKLSDCCVAFTGLWDELLELRSYQEEGDPKIIALLDRFKSIRIQRGAEIGPVYHAEENDLTHLTDS